MSARYNKGTTGKIIVQDWNILSTYDDTAENARYYQLTDRQCAALIALCEFLSWSTRYNNPPSGEVLETFADDATYRLMNPVDPGECQTFPPFATFITYEPNDPFRTPDLIPAGYLFPPWYIANTAAEVTYDAQLGAAVTTLERLPALTPLSGYPRFRVTVVGAGTVTLNFAAVNLGGMVQISTDDDISTIELVDLIQDKIAVPPETANIISKSYYFAVPAEHRVDCIMLPALQDQIPPVMFGGGLVSVQLCGFGLALSEGGLMLRQSVSDPCILEQSADGEIWTEAFNFAECPSIATGDDVTGIEQQTNMVNYQTSIREAERIQADYAAEYTGDPSSINPDAPDDNFNGDSSDNRDLALCAASAAYVRYFAAAKIRQLDLVYGGVFTALSLLLILIPGFGWAMALGLGIALGGATLIAGVSYSAAKTALNDSGALDEVSCCMADTLTGLANTEANFSTALDACGFTPGSNSAIVRDFIDASLDSNYLTFQDYLGTAYKAINDGEPVVCPCDTDFAPEIANFADCMGFGIDKGTIVHVVDDEYDVTTTADPTPGFTAHIREVSGQLFAYRHLTGSVISSSVKDIGGTCVFSGVGGGAINQNQYLQELSLYTGVATTIRIRFYTPTE